MPSGSFTRPSSDGRCHIRTAAVETAAGSTRRRRGDRRGSPQAHRRRHLRRTGPRDRFLAAEPRALTQYGLRCAAFTPSSQPPVPRGYALKSSALASQARPHTHRLALCRGRLEAERTVYRLLLAEPPRTRPFGRSATWSASCSTTSATEAPLIAFVERIAGEGEQFVAAVRARIAATQGALGRAAAEPRDKAAAISHLRVAIQCNGSQATRQHQRKERLMADDQIRMNRANTTT